MDPKISVLVCLFSHQNFITAASSGLVISRPLQKKKKINQTKEFWPVFRLKIHLEDLNIHRISQFFKNHSIFLIII